MPTVSTTHFQPEAPWQAVGAHPCQATRASCGQVCGDECSLCCKLYLTSHRTLLRCVCMKKSVFNFKPW